MCPHVGLEVGTLEVGLVAVLLGTNVAAYTRDFWLQRAQSLLQRSGARRGGDGRQLGAAGRDQRGLDVQCGNNWLWEEQHHRGCGHLTLQQEDLCRWRCTHSGWWGWDR